MIFERKISLYRSMMADSNVTLPKFRNLEFDISSSGMETPLIMAGLIKQSPDLRTFLCFFRIRDKILYVTFPVKRKLMKIITAPLKVCGDAPQL